MLCSILLFQPPNRLPSVMYAPHSPPGTQQFFCWIRERLSAARSAAPPPEDAADPVPPPPIPLGQRPGDQRGRGPLRRRSRNQEVPGVSLPTFSTRESRPGCGAERPHQGSQGPPAPHKSPPGAAGRSARIRGRRGHPPPQNLPRCGIKKKKPKKVLAKKANLYDNKGEPK